MCVCLLEHSEGCNSIEPITSSSSVRSAWRDRKERYCLKLGVPVSKVVARRPGARIMVQRVGVDVLCRQKYRNSAKNT